MLVKGGKGSALIEITTPKGNNCTLSRPLSETQDHSSQIGDREKPGAERAAKLILVY